MGATLKDWLAQCDPARPTVGVLFYRSHWMSGNLAFVDTLVRAVERQGGNALPVFTLTLKDTAAPPPGVAGVGRWPAAFACFYQEGRRVIDVLISTISFALGEINPDGPTLGPLISKWLFGSVPMVIVALMVVVAAPLLLF